MTIASAHNQWPTGFFVCGTDTGVGKTLIASALVHAYRTQGARAVGMKPVASGCELHGDQLQNEDVMQLIAATQEPLQTEHINCYQFQPAIAPHIAAQDAGIRIQLAPILERFHALANTYRPVIVEGAGGFLVPLDGSLTFADVAVALNLPVILVVGLRLGCINHALLTVEAIRARGLALAGWVGNNLQPDMPRLTENLQTLEHMISAPCLGVVPYQPVPSYQDTASSIQRYTA